MCNVSRSADQQISSFKGSICTLSVNADTRPLPIAAEPVTSPICRTAFSPADPATGRRAAATASSPAAAPPSSCAELELVGSRIGSGGITNDHVDEALAPEAQIDDVVARSDVRGGGGLAVDDKGGDRPALRP